MSCFILLRESISAEGLVVVYACADECEGESFPRQWPLKLLSPKSDLPTACSHWGNRGKKLLLLWPYEKLISQRRDKLHSTF